MPTSTNVDPSDIITISGESIPLGEKKQLELPVAKLFDYTDISIPVQVIRGKKAGPVLSIFAAVHGDEINGVEICKRLLTKKGLSKHLTGTLIVTPVVNVFGFNRNSRYLPDRRDLNRCFPGSKNGSLGGQIAKILMDEIIEHSTHSIDLHTGAIHRTNLPQVRACLDDDETRRLAQAFRVPVMLNATTRDGSLRQAALEKGIPMLLYEGGEALRYDEKAIQTGLKGILSVMNSIGMLDDGYAHKHGAIKVTEPFTETPDRKEVFVARSSHWVRAPHSGSLRVKKKIGNFVEKDTLLGVISNPYGSGKVEVRSPKTGIIIGMTKIPLVNQSDALFHIATFKDSGAVEESIGIYEDNLTPEFE